MGGRYAFFRLDFPVLTVPPASIAASANAINADVSKDTFESQSHIADWCDSRPADPLLSTSY